MAREMFHDVNEPSIGVGGTRRYTVPLSILGHTTIVAVLLVLPLLAADVLPAPPTLLSFISAAPTPPPPPAAPQTTSTARGNANITADAIPLEAPHEIRPERVAPTAPQIPGMIENGSASVPAGVFAESVLPPPTPQTAVVPAPVRPGGLVSPPIKIKEAPLAYPSIARASRVEGVVIIEATIGVDGTVQDARILRSIPLLDDAALAAVRQWEYTPTLLNGTPVPVIMTVTVAFRLQ